ncbi:MAG: hypothetical protein RSE45_00025 [Bacilli bacterium]
MKYIKVLLNYTGIILSTLCAFIIFILCFFYISLDVSKKVVSKDNVNMLIRDVNILKLPLKDFITTNEETTIEDYIYNKAHSVGVSKEVISNILNDSDYINLISSYISSYSFYILKGTKMPIVKSSTFINIFNNNKNDIESSIGRPLSDKEVLSTKKYIETITNEFNSYIKRSTPKNMIYLNYLFSGSAKIACICGIILCIILIGFLRLNFYSMFIYSSFPMFICGLVFALSSAAKTPINDLINTNNTLVLRLIDIIGNNIFNNLFFSGVLLIVISLIFYCIGFYIRNKTSISS